MNKYLSVCAALAFSFVTTAVSAAETPNTPATADSTTASASESASTRLNAFSIALLAGHSFKDGFRTGFGGRVGYTVANKLYLGGSFVWHVGNTRGPVESSVYYGGGEVGYDLNAGPFVIRPYAGVGAASISAKVTLPSVGTYGGGKLTVSESRFAFWPGATLLFPFEDGAAFVGVDAKFVVVENANAFTTYGTFGMAL